MGSSKQDSLYSALAKRLDNRHVQVRHIEGVWGRQYHYAKGSGTILVLRDESHAHELGCYHPLLTYPSFMIDIYPVSGQNDFPAFRSNALPRYGSVDVALWRRYLTMNGIVTRYFDADFEVRPEDSWQAHIAIIFDETPMQRLISKVLRLFPF